MVVAPSRGCTSTAAVMTRTENDYTPVGVVTWRVW